MSDEKNNGNYYIIGAAVVFPIATLLAFFALSGFNTNADEVNTKSADVAETEKAIPVHEIIINETAKDIIEDAKKDAMATKANEAAIHTQVNEAVKNAENEE